MFEETKINEKEAEDGPFKIRSVVTRFLPDSLRLLLQVLTLSFGQVTSGISRKTDCWRRATDCWPV